MNVEHRTSNVEHRIMMSLRSGFLYSEPLNPELLNPGTSITSVHIQTRQCDPKGCYELGKIRSEGFQA
jgi:hypothetical protein